MGDQPYIPFSEILAELHRLCESQQTGMLFISTNEQHAVQLHLNDGHIVFVCARNRFGLDALPLMAKIKAGTYRFFGRPVSPPQDILPDTQDILDFLANTTKVLADSRPSTEIPVTDKATDETGPQDALMNIFQEELALVIGPMAAIICQGRSDRLEDFKTTWEELTQVMPNHATLVRFRNKVLERLLAQQSRSIPQDSSSKAQAILDFLADPTAINTGQPTPANDKVTDNKINSNKKVMSETTRQILQEELALFIGPIAEIVCQECLSRTQNIEKTVEDLAQSIPNSAVAARFKKGVFKRLQQ